MDSKGLLPVLPKLAPPMKKTQQYYSFRENLWNHAYFTCEKVAKFYQKPQANFDKTHPTETQLRDIEESDKLQKKDRRAQAERTLDFGRMRKRKLERQISKQRSSSSTRPIPVSPKNQSDSSTLLLTVIRPAPVSQVFKNQWTLINFLPVQQIRKFIPPKELELDDRISHSGATETLLAKRAHWEAMEQAKVAQKRELHNQARVDLMRRHQATEEVRVPQLEKKAGVLKYRSNFDPLASTTSSHGSFSPYGMSRVSQQSPRSEAFSQSKGIYKPKDPMLYSEFRGLVQRENPEAVKKLRHALTQSTSSVDGSQMYEKRPAWTRSSLPVTPAKVRYRF